VTDTQPTRQAIAAIDRSLPGKVTGRLRKAVDLMVWQAARRADAALAAGMTDHSLRAAFRRPHVMAYFNRELEVLRAGERPRNIARLCEIRDAADNMPAVNAIKVLEQLDAEAISRPSANSPTPGVVINVISASPSPPVIDAMPFAPSAPPQPAKLEPAIDADPIFRLDR
jgi:hypothetical protein